MSMLYGLIFVYIVIAIAWMKSEDKFHKNLYIGLAIVVFILNMTLCVAVDQSKLKQEPEIPL